MPAGGEQVIRAVRRRVQRLGEDLTQLSLQAGARPAVAYRYAPSRPLDGAQRRSIQLASWRARELIVDSPELRLHRGRQPLARTRGGERDACVCGTGRGHEVRDKTPRVIGDDRGSANGIRFGQNGFDLARLDALSAHLELLVRTSDVLQARRRPANPVAGAVETRARLGIGSRVGHEGKCRAPRQVDVPEGEVIAAQPQLADRSRHHGSKRTVEHEGTDTEDREADGRWPVVEHGSRRTHGHLGRPVGVTHAHVRRHARTCIGGHGLPGEDEGVEPSPRVRVLGSKEGGRRDRHMRHAGLA